MISSKLSGREKAMLYFLLCFAIVLLGTYFIIIPGYNKSNSLEADLASKQQVYNTMLATQNSLSDTSKKIEERKNEIVAIQSNFFGSLHTELIDRIILGFLRSHNLLPESVSFTPATVSTVDPVMPVDGLILPEGEVLGMSVSVKGNIEDLKAMLNDLTADGRILISDFEYAGDEEDEESGTFNFNLKMIRLTNTVDIDSTQAADNAGDSETIEPEVELDDDDDLELE